jgi:type I restriction enzyme S subunit
MDALCSFGATMTSLNQDIVSRITLPFPSYAAQKKIAAVLSAYDELMENNRRRIALLEKLSEEIYREWFVRLRFPGHEKVRLVKGVPEGWTRDAVSSFTLILRRGVAPVYDENGEGLAINQKCIRGGKLSLTDARKQSRDVAEARYVQVGDVLVNSTGEGTLGRVAQVFTSIDRAIVDSHVTIVRPKPDVPMHYFGMTLRGWEPHLSIMGQGSTNQTELAPTTIGRLLILMPPQKLGERFEELVSPVFKQSEILRHQNAALRQTRDLLLPRLISGKLSVEDPDIQFPPGMAAE